MRYKMYLVVWTIALTMLFYVTSRANGADWSVRFGPGIEGQQLTGATKKFGLRREEEMLHGIYNSLEVGGYSESTVGRKQAGAISAQIGAKPGPVTGVYGYAFVGPCLISATDTELSTHLQFATDIGFGVRDRDTFMSVGYGHISNAGIKLPNAGRDYLSFSVGISL